MENTDGSGKDLTLPTLGNDVERVRQPCVSRKEQSTEEEQEPASRDSPPGVVKQEGKRSHKKE